MQPLRKTRNRAVFVGVTRRRRGATRRRRTHISRFFKKNSIYNSSDVQCTDDQRVNNQGISIMCLALVCLISPRNLRELDSVAFTCSPSHLHHPVASAKAEATGPPSKPLNNAPPANYSEDLALDERVRSGDAQRLASPIFLASRSERSQLVQTSLRCMFLVI